MPRQALEVVKASDKSPLDGGIPPRGDSILLSLSGLELIVGENERCEVWGLRNEMDPQRGNLLPIIQVKKYCLIIPWIPVSIPHSVRARVWQKEKNAPLGDEYDKPTHTVTFQLDWKVQVEPIAFLSPGYPCLFLTPFRVWCMTKEEGNSVQGLMYDTIKKRGSFHFLFFVNRYH